MKIIKNINNNYAIAIDKAGNQVIISGKGIGFGSVPRTIDDMSQINRSFYDVDEMYIDMINQIPEKMIDIASDIVDKARILIENPISSNIVFTLADHINFSIERNKKHMNIRLPIIYDIQHLFEKEYEVGLYGIELLSRFKINLPKEEAAYIAIHIVNAEEQTKQHNNINEQMISDITRITEKEFNIEIDKENVNYSRFISHMHYLLKRGKSKHLIKTENDKIYQSLVDQYPQTYVCSEKVSEHIEKTIKIKLTDEEKLYLMLHINRLCTREDCNH